MNQNYREFYESISGPLASHPHGREIVTYANRVFTYSFYIAYPLLLARLALYRSDLLVRSILVPLIGFVVLTIVRAMINQQRPYEKWNYEPLIAKDTKGNSCPSRHVFSAVVIAMVFLVQSRVLGILFLAIAALGALIRVVGGVHYPHDVAAGYVLGILAGLFMFL